MITLQQPGDHEGITDQFDESWLHRISHPTMPHVSELEPWSFAKNLRLEIDHRGLHARSSAPRARDYLKFLF